MNQMEQSLQMALADFKSGKFKFGREAARAYSVLSLTSKDRLNGIKPQRIIRRHEQ
jgi:hypothetical protein